MPPAADRVADVAIEQMVAVMVLVLLTSSVYPSGGAAAIAAAVSEPFAPGRFSATAG